MEKYINLKKKIETIHRAIKRRVKIVRWDAVLEGSVATIGGIYLVKSGAIISATGKGAILGVPMVLLGASSAAYGSTQIIVGFSGNKIPFTGTVDAVIKIATGPGDLGRKLNAINIRAYVQI